MCVCVCVYVCLCVCVYAAVGAHESQWEDHWVLMLGSYGALATLVFSAPKAPLAQVCVCVCVCVCVYTCIYVRLYVCSERQRT